MQKTGAENSARVCRPWTFSALSCDLVTFQQANRTNAVPGAPPVAAISDPLKDQFLDFVGANEGDLWIPNGIPANPERLPFQPNVNAAYPNEIPANAGLMPFQQNTNAGYANGNAQNTGFIPLQNNNNAAFANVNLGNAEPIIPYQPSMNVVYGDTNLENVKPFPFYGNDMTHTQGLIPLSERPQIPVYGFPKVSDLERNFRESSIQEKSSDGTPKPSGQTKTANINVESEARANMNLIATASHIQTYNKLCPVFTRSF